MLVFRIGPASLSVITPLDLAVMQDLGYPVDEAGWSDEGGALAGVSGEPVLTGTGLLMQGALIDGFPLRSALLVRLPAG